MIGECSHLYDATLLADALQPDYNFQAVVIDAKSHGTRSVRKRMWMVALHQEYIVRTWSSLENVVHMFERRCSDDFSFRDYMIASNDELDTELRWAMSRPTSMAKEMTFEELKSLAYPFLAALTRTELTYRDLYLARGIPESHAVSLNQNPNVHPQKSPDANHLHSMIKNAGIVWVESADRWLTPAEVFISQGFPVCTDLASPRTNRLHRCCSFAPQVVTPPLKPIGSRSSRRGSERSSVPLVPLASPTPVNIATGYPASSSVSQWLPPARVKASRTRTSMAGQAGNSMNTTVCAAVMCPNCKLD